MAALKMGSSKGGKKWKKDKVASKSAVACKGKGKFACGVVYKMGKKRAVVRTSKDLLWRMPSKLASLSHLGGTPDIKLPTGTKGPKLKVSKGGKRTSKGSKKTRRVSGDACTQVYRKLVELENKHGSGIKHLLSRVKAGMPKGGKKKGRRVSGKIEYSKMEMSSGTPEVEPYTVD